MPSSRLPTALRLNPAVVGGFYCLYSAVSFVTVSAIFRFLTLRCDRMWLLFVKETVATVVMAVWLLVLARRGQRVLPSRRATAALAVAGLISQLFGNLPSLWALSVVGLTVVLPVTFVANLVSGAVLGRVLLGERVSARSLVAIGLLIAAVVLLSIGAENANRSIATTADVATGPFWVALAVAAAATAGVAFCVLAVVIRRAVTGTTTLRSVALIVPGMGTLSLGPLGFFFSGWEGLTSASEFDLSLMLAAGAINLFGFLALVRGLRMTPVAHANVWSASQVAIGAVIGMTIFHEPPGPWLVLGVILTVAGMVLIGRSAAEPELSI